MKVSVLLIFELKGAEVESAGMQQDNSECHYHISEAALPDLNALVLADEN